jgi:class 3 adenylate cyclase
MTPPAEPRPLREALRARIHRELEKELGLGQALPEGTVTILFTDVAGSAELVRSLGDERARTVLRRHDEIVREALRAAGGSEIEHPGDSFMAAFRTASAAVGCALDIHRRLAAERAGRPETPWVRIGMDAGEVISDGPGYFGATVFRASRISDVARGGATVVSQTVRLLATGAPADFVDIGEHDLKGLGGGHRLFRVEDPAGPPRR